MQYAKLGRTGIQACQLLLDCMVTAAEPSLTLEEIASLEEPYAPASSRA